jgi:hypothetical protein
MKAKLDLISITYFELVYFYVSLIVILDIDQINLFFRVFTR